MSTLKEICKEQTEMIDEMRRNTKELTEENEKLSEQYNKMLEERNSLIDDLSWYKAKVSRLERENRFLLSRKDNLFDSWRDENKRSVALSKKLEQLERQNGELQEVIEDKNSDLLFTEDENKQLKESRDWDYEYIVKVNEENKRLEDENEQLKKENEMIDEQFTDYIDETCGYLKLLSEFSQHIGKKPSSSTYKYFRAKLDDLNITEDK